MQQIRHTALQSILEYMSHSKARTDQKNSRRSQGLTLQTMLSSNILAGEFYKKCSSKMLFHCRLVWQRTRLAARQLRILPRVASQQTGNLVVRSLPLPLPPLGRSLCANGSLWTYAHPRPRMRRYFIQGYACLLVRLRGDSLKAHIKLLLRKVLQSIGAPFQLKG